MKKERFKTADGQYLQVGNNQIDYIWKFDSFGTLRIYPIVWVNSEGEISYKDYESNGGYKVELVKNVYLNQKQFLKTRIEEMELDISSLQQRLKRIKGLYDNCY